MESKPIVFSFILFALQGSKTDENTYLPMLAACWNSLLLNGNLQKGDILYLTIDSSSFEFLKRDYVSATVLNEFRAKGVQFILNLQPQPASLLEGFLWKYSICSFPPVQAGLAHVYIDADTVCLRPLDHLRELLYKKEGFIICPERPLSEGNYSDVAIPQDFLQKFPMLPGCSAGLFAFRLSKPHLDRFSQLLATRLRECNQAPAGYCIEQPYFNYVLWTMITETPSLHSYSLQSNKDILLNNLKLDTSPTAIFLNLAGEPGNATPHVAKWLAVSQILIQRAQGLYLSA